VERNAQTNHFRFAVRSDRGVRTRNEDAAYADPYVIALADGMGGHPAGDVAASLMIQPFGRIVRDHKRWDVVDYLREATLQGEGAIATHVAKHPHHRGMGTTLTAALLSGPRLGLVHAGDSRAYLWREGRLYQLSRDDTLVQALLDEGALPVSAARSHPQRHVVLRALMGSQTRLSLLNYEVLVGDRILLCSDGASDVLSDDVLESILAFADVASSAAQIVKSALEAGSRDNVTCVVAEVVTGSTAVAEPALAGAAAGGPQ
jgi:serine/threonine protein phosphatase PrpC